MKKAVLVLFAACGGSSGPAKAPVDPAPPRDPVDHVETHDDGDDGVDVASTRGHLDPSEVDDALQSHEQKLQDCYLSAVGTRKWLGGHVELHWDVDGTGAITDATIATSDLGAWPIEQCMLGEMRAVTFPAPHGGKPTDVSVPLDFDAPRPANPWDGDMTAAEVKKHLPDLAKCAKNVPDPTDVTVTMYVGTRGKVQSAGFASPAPIDDTWAACAEKKVTAWQLTDPKGQVVKAAFVYREGQTPAKPDQDDE
jgi:hypothetical protein